jgi:hypothetical protein
MFWLIKAVVVMYCILWKFTYKLYDSLNIFDSKKLTFTRLPFINSAVFSDRQLTGMIKKAVRVNNIFIRVLVEYCNNIKN